MGKKHRVIVIGAGISGLACARELKYRGHEVVILEARHRVGGRLKGEPLQLQKDRDVPDDDGNQSDHEETKYNSLSINRPRNSRKRSRTDASSSSAPESKPDTKSKTIALHPPNSVHIDMGGALIHGVENNPVYKVVKQMGIPLHPISDYCLLLDANGWPFDPKEDEKTSTLFNECLDETFARIQTMREGWKRIEDKSTGESHKEQSSSSDNGGREAIEQTKSPSENGPRSKEAGKPTKILPDNTSSSNSKADSGNDNFGELFDQVCFEKGLYIPNKPDTQLNSTSKSPTSSAASFQQNNPLWEWHKANLELPTGADFHDLGYSWNDDEPYGFTGHHAAIESSWKFCMEKLAEGLDVWYQSPVCKIETVESEFIEIKDDSGHGEQEKEKEENKEEMETDNVKEEQTSSDDNKRSPEVEHSTKSDEDKDANKEENEESGSSADKQATGKKTPTRSSRSRSVKKKTKSFRTGTRSSRRIQRLESNLRRSSRNNKGQIQTLQILDYSAVCYDDPSKSLATGRKQDDESNEKGKRKRKGKQSRNNEEESSDKVRDDDDIFGSKVQVTLQDGTVLEANAVVCTLPLGVLKIPPRRPGHIQFEPPLPATKLDAIQKLGCGLLNKCAMSFDTVFWQDSDFLGLAGKEHSYLVLNAWKYAGDKPVLIFMFGGAFAKEIESWKDKDIVQDCLDVLKKICGKEQVPDPIDYCVTRWGEEQYSRMSFTYIPPGVHGGQELSRIGDAICDPARPGKPMIMFAGEHTTPYHPSTMHGAFASGVREAYRYDLYLNPQLNNSMRFEDDEIMYVHTFPTRRAYKSPKGTSADITNETDLSAANPSSGVVRSRRKRFAGMSLRKQPKQADLFLPSTEILGLDKKEETKSPPSTPMVASRRSQRSLSNRKRPLSLDDSPTSEKDDDDVMAKREQKDQLNALEDRILLRSLRSYGRNTTLVRSKVVPVWGSKRKRSADQIQTRWNNLATAELPSLPAPPSRASWKRWVVKVIDKEIEKDMDDDFEVKAENQGTRRSARGRVVNSRFSL